MVGTLPLNDACETPVRAIGTLTRGFALERVTEEGRKPGGPEEAERWESSEGRDDVSGRDDARGLALTVDEADPMRKVLNGLNVVKLLLRAHRGMESGLNCSMRWAQRI